MCSSDLASTRTTSQIDLDGNARFANAYVTGRVEATEGYFGKNKRVTIGDDGLTIERPDGAIWMQDGLVHQDYTVGGFDPPYMTNGSGQGSTFKAFFDVSTFWDSREDRKSTRLNSSHVA